MVETGQASAGVRRRPRKAARSLRLALSLAALVAALIPIVPGEAAGARKPTKLLRVAVTPGDGKLAVRVAARPRSSCTLRVTARGKSARFPAVRTDGTGNATFEWAVPKNAPSGRWTFTVRCRRDGRARVARTRPLIITGGNGRGDLIEPSSLHLDDGTLGGRGAGTPCARDQNGANVCFPGNPFDSYRGGPYTGECTWYAAGRRPDLWGKTTGNAKQWLDQARARGVPTGRTPAVGAIAVQTGGVYGHVMYVTAVVDGGATVVVDDSNYRNDHVVRYGRRVPASAIAGYVYGGPAATGPGGDRAPGDTGTTPPESQQPPAGVGTRVLADVDADGRDDAVVMFKDSGTAMVATALGGGGFGAPTKWSHGHSVGADRYFLADANGDGRADLVAFFAAQGVWNVSLSSGSGFYTPTAWAYGHGVGTSRQWVADASGDGRADVLTFDSNSGDWYVSVSDGNGFQTFQRWIAGHGVGSTDQTAGDTNGDGRADAAIWIAGDGSWYVGLSSGSNFGYPGHWSSGHGVGTDKRFLGDGNGDGKADEVFFHAGDGRWYLGSSDGNGFYAPTEWAYGHGVGTSEQFLGDVTGDRKDDLVTFDRVTGDWYVSVSDGNGFQAFQRWSTGHGAGS